MAKSNNTDNFSVALGLFDYINPICYSITTITLLKNMKALLDNASYYIFLIGGIISILFGLAIPTVKFIVGLGIMKFRMPVNLVLCVNTGIFISGVALLSQVFNINNWVTIIGLLIILGLLALIGIKSKKLNTIAVLIGMVGYLFLYITLIKYSYIAMNNICVVLYALAIVLFVLLVLIGIFSDLKNSRVHWGIEICNVVCQFSVALATIILFKK